MDIDQHLAFAWLGDRHIGRTGDEHRSWERVDLHLNLARMGVLYDLESLHDGCQTERRGGD
jgi:hypothetical protein